MAAPASAQLNGTYTIGGTSPNYASIDAALTALGVGVSGPVTFLIRSGTYTPPTAGWRLPNIPTMNATNTVTFRPDAGATVTLSGNSGTTNQSGVFTIDGGKYYIIDGSNTNGGTSRDMTIIQTEVNYNPAVYFKNNSDFNIVRNCNLRASGSSLNSTYGGGTVFFGSTNTTSGNDSNLVTNCVLGDPAGINRSYCGVYMYGSSAYRNIGNRIERCDILNFRVYGIYADLYNTGYIFRKNTVRMTMPGTSSVIYGIYMNETSVPANPTVDSNRVYRLIGTSTSSFSVYGIYSNTNSLTSGTTQISNNMVSMAENGYVHCYPIYINSNASTTSTLTYNVYYNTVYLGGTATSFAQAMALYRYSYNSSGLSPANTINHRNNIYYSEREGGSSTSYGLYNYASPTGGWTSNNNLIQLNTASNYYTTYYNFSLYLTLASYQTSGQDVSSVGGGLVFTDAMNGDLHINPARRNTIEGRGAVVAGFTTDFDGQTRNATTPDIGADEGNFLGPLAVDAGADRMATPLVNATIKSGTSILPVGWVTNYSTSTQSVPVRMRIRNSSSTIVYEDLQNFSIAALVSQRVAFNATGNVLGTTTLTAGTYTVQLMTELVGDLDAANNMYSFTINVKDPLAGIYTINKTGAGARNFTSFTSAINDLNVVGVSAPVTFKVATGVYDSTTEVFPLRIVPASGVGAANPVAFVADSLAWPVITNMNSNPLIDLVDADYITFSGANTLPNEPRAFKVINTGSGPTMRLFDGAQYNTIRNMHLMSNNTTTTGVFYIANRSVSTLGNSYNTMLNNTFGDSLGVIRSFNNFYMAGDATYRNIQNRIEGNAFINWGTNTNGGGYGLFWSSNNNEVKVLRNEFKQTNAAALTTAGGIYGIYITNTNNTNDTIAYNKISSLTSPSPTAALIGIWVNTASQATPMVIHNNMITLDQPQGNMYGIYITTASPTTYQILHNSIAIRGANPGPTASLTAGVRMTSTANLTVRNNIIVNERTYPSAVTSYTLYRTVSGTMSTANNVLWATGSGTAIGYNGSATYTTLANWQSVGYDAGSFGAAPPFVNAAAGDLHLNPQPVFPGEGQGLALGSTLDIDQQTRDALAPDIGADEGDFNGGGVLLTYPNGGDAFMVGELVPVQYTTNRAMAVNIDYTTDNGATWTTLASVNPTVRGANATNVTVPSVVTANGKFRVINQRNVWEADTSNGPSRVIRKLQLTYPNGTELLHVGDTTHIRWARLPGEMMSDYLDFEYSPDGGTTWLPVVTQIPAFLDSVRWIVPNTPTTNALVRVFNREAPRFWDTSDVPFEIQTSNLTVLGPNGGERYDMNAPVTVTWMAVNTGDLTLNLSTDNGVSWRTVGTNIPAAAGTYTFTPDPIPTKLALVRLIDQDRPWMRDQSDRVWEISAPPSITVYTPVAGDVFVRNSTTVITWDAPNVSQVNILYSSNGGSSWTTVISNVTASEGSRVWTVPNQNTTQGKIRVQESGGPAFGESGLFSIIDPTVPTLTLIAPNGGEKYTVGDTATVSWSSSGLTQVNLLYSTDGGNNWTTMQNSVTASQAQFKWVVPNRPSTTCKVKVVSVTPAISDESANVFEIARKPNPQIVLLYPNGGENLTVDSTVQIRWTAQDITGDVTIEWSADEGRSWVQLATVPASLGTWEWKVPDTTTKKALVRVRAGGSEDVSAAVFEISRIFVPQLRVTKPDGGEDWRYRSKQMIEWDNEPSVAKIDIEYSIDGGQNWLPIDTSVAMIPNRYEWTIPTLTNMTTTALVRIKNSANAGQFDISNAPFTMQPPIAGIDAVAGLGAMQALGAYPNPFSESTELRWRQAKGGNVEIRLYEASGRQAAAFAIGAHEAGQHGYTVSGAGLANGVYFYEIRVAEAFARGVMVVAR